MSPLVIEIPSGRLGYGEVVDRVLKHGRQRSPRGVKTYDLGWVTTVIASPYDALPVGVGRNVNRAIAAAEAVQLIGAFSDPEMLTRVSPNFSRFTEPDGTFHGAYGNRIGYQLVSVIRKLSDDPDSRRAVINLWDGQLDNIPDKNDYPCTVALGFEISDNKLVMNTVMRSNDVWLGVPYDWFQFTQLQLTVAHLLAVEPGEYRHTAWSLHLYEHDVERAESLVPPRMFAEGTEAFGFGTPTDDVYDVITRVRRLPYEMVPHSTITERWYHEQLRDRS